MMRFYMMCKGTDSTRKLLNFEKPHAKMYNYMDKSISKKTKQNGKNKSQMRAEFKLCYKGFKLSGSHSFEDMYLHTTLVCKSPRGT